MVVGANRWETMVKLNLIVEGGVLTGDVSAETANNAEALRESLYKFLQDYLVVRMWKLRYSWVLGIVMLQNNLLKLKHQ